MLAIKFADRNVINVLYNRNVFLSIPLYFLGYCCFHSIIFFYGGRKCDAKSCCASKCFPMRMNSYCVCESFVRLGHHYGFTA